jgi:regulator of protease activity HflC (stomatin/prohibitin superfamily)
MLNRLIDLLITVWESLLPFTVIYDFERGVILRLGRYNRSIGPGFHWRWPLGIEAVFIDNVVPHPIALAQQSLTTADKLTIVLTPIITYRIQNVRKFLLELEGGEQAIMDVAPGIITDYVMEHDWEILCDDKNVSEELRTLIHEAVKEWGVKVTKVQLRDLSIAKSYRLWLGAGE